jgi:hypothetical protein
MTDAPTATPSRRMLLLVVALAALAAVAIAALLVNVFERKQEAKNPFYRVVDRARVSRAPTATCPTCARVVSRSATTR